MSFKEVWICMGLGIGLATAEAAESTSPGNYFWQGAASFVSENPSALGAELNAALLFLPLTDHELFLGPRVGVAWAGSSEVSRVDIDSGVEGTLWMANLLGIGAGADWVAPRWTYSPSHATAAFRAETYGTARLARFQDAGAWAIRVGPFYDTQYQWGLRVGLVLQASGVPNAGSASD